ncbi:hypothetical protein FEFB_01930 [Fructobacillus sp. EFB-N1]|uniref:hypothetical protein n=1 Tax=Fructobacillus sp. EFB-N1 TaxID=1658766 RepID=UPI00064DCA15|nr:hypothetical protein [Fructobacillus sp. EFB-N1]KMK54076.1 hypothetical protein FEFB_01930 [Fructobacillus sp. EFB-N1]
MNNFRILQQLSQQSIEQVGAATGLQISDLQAFADGQKELAIADLERLCLYFSHCLDQLGRSNQANLSKHPIHIRLTTDYLLNLGISLSDWISLQWALEGNWAGEKLAVGFFTADQTLVKVVENSADFTKAFAGYLILALEGEFTPYIDEIHDNVHYDWRILRYRSQANFQDITNQLANTPLKEIEA